jgi:hypothetical protein
MPSRVRPPPESRAKAAVSREPARGGVAPSPMEKFNDLARKVVNVPREELRQEQERYDAANSVRREQRKRRVSSCKDAKSR